MIKKNQQSIAAIGTSVIIPAHNADKTIADCLNALLAQDYPQNAYEIIVVDDASTDTTGDILEKYSAHDLISVIHHKENRALAAARNSGINAARGSVLIFLDADILVLPDFIHRHTKYFSDSKVAGVFSHLKPGPDIRYDKYQRYLYESKRGAKKYSSNNPIPYHTFLFTATSVRKSVVETVGTFDENIVHYGGEDTEYSFRISQQYPNSLYHAAEIEVYHKHYRPIEGVIENFQSFGQYVVPYLVEKHPEFDRLYGYSFIFPKKSIAGLFKKTIGIALKSKFSFICLRICYNSFPYPFSNFIIRLLLASALWQGIAQSETSHINHRD